MVYRKKISDKWELLNKDPKTLKEAIGAALHSSGYNLTKAALLVGASRDTLRRTVEKLGMYDTIEKYGREAKAADRQAEIDRWLSFQTNHTKRSFNEHYKAARAKGFHHATARKEAKRLTIRQLARGAVQKLQEEAKKNATEAEE